MSAHGRPKGELPLGGKARSAKGAPVSALSHWFFHGIDAADRARPVVSNQTPRAVQSAGARKRRASAPTTRLLQWAHGLVQRLRQRAEPDTTLDVLALARSVEGQLPSLATELRFIALRRPEAPD